MRNRFVRPRDMGAAEALLSAALLFVALFAWGASTDMLSREGLASTDNWAWRLWQVGALLMGIPGVWWLWRGTQRVVWTRGAALAVLALAVFLNVYGNGFFDGHVGDVWKATNPIFLGCTVIAVPLLWARGSLIDRVAALFVGIQGVVLFINAYFVNNGTIWDALDPLRILTLLAWSVVALAEDARRRSEMGG